MAALLPFHKGPDLIVASNDKENDMVGEFEDDSVSQGGTDFPVVSLPVLEAKSLGQRGQAVQVVHESVYGPVCLLLAVRRELLESAVKAGLELVLHGYFIIFLRCALAESESGNRSPFSFSTRASLAASFL